MHYSFYENHKNKRVSKIIEILGVDWFKDKTILELGACHGDVGIEFTKLGSHVTFADARIENLKEIEDKIQNPDIRIIDQNFAYNLKQRFDLVLHLGTLWHLQFWYNDLYYALSHSDLMILETRVLPIKTNIGLFQKRKVNQYVGTTDYIPVLTQNDIEKRIVELNHTYTRYDDSSLNINESEENISMVYDWDELNHYSANNKSIHHRRLWCIKK
jgi:hypothetical protein